MARKIASQYVFSKYSEKNLVLFTRAIRSQNLKYCKSGEESSVICNLIPLEDNIQEILTKDENETRPIICISDSEDDAECDVKIAEEADKKSCQSETVVDITSNDDTLMVSKIEDVCAVIVETLEAEKCLSADVLVDIQNMPEQQIKRIYTSLLHCTSDNITDMGESLLNINLTDEDSLLTSYVDTLFIKKLTQEHNVRIEKLLNNLTVKYPKLLINLLLHKLILSEENINTKVLSQYISRMADNHKAHLLRNLLFGIESLQEKHIILIEALLFTNIDYEILKKLVEILSGNADEFGSDKNYGKLLFTVIQLLGSGVKHLENALKYIISRHSSVWKAKAQKLLNSNFNDSLLLTQSVHF